MKTTIRAAAAIVAAGFIATGCGAATLASSGTPATSSTPATTRTTATAQPATPKYVVLNCSFNPVVAPSTIIISCADAGTGVQNVYWTTWSPNLASGYGTFWENDCTPNCAAGHFNHYPSLDVLWGNATVKGQPADRRYTNLTVIFTGKTRPPVYVLQHGKPVATYPLTQTFPAI
jgi:hypothetical protein